MSDMKQIRDALCLFKSMVDGGEDASQTSSEAFESAMNSILTIQSELTRLRSEVERLETECKATMSTLDGMTEDHEAERKRIAEAVENVEIVSWKDNLDGTTDCLPNYGAVNELRDRIERGDFAKGENDGTY